MKKWVKPGLTASEACHRPALIEGQKENKMEKGEDKNTMSKAKLVVLIISIVIAVAILPLMFTLYQKFYVEPTLQRYPPELRPYIDLTPFLATSYALCTFAVWVLLFSLWMGKAIIKTRKTTMATALILLCIVGFSLVSTSVYATIVFTLMHACIFLLFVLRGAPLVAEV